VSDTESAHVDPLCAEEGGEAGEGFVGARGVVPGAEHLQGSRLPIEARLDPADEAVADEDGEDVVAVLPLVVARNGKFFSLRYRRAEEEEQ
jgi:hypothetical protein